MLNNIIIRKWGEPGYWTVFPDEQSAIDWQELELILQRKIKQIENQRKENDPDAFLFLGLEKISQIVGVHSRESIGKHVSFFMARNRKDCRRISENLRSQIQRIVDTLSRSDRERCHILDHLFSICKGNGWSVHLLRTEGLKTTDPTCPINFWHYTPQSDLDKAPVKTRVVPANAREDPG